MNPQPEGTKNAFWMITAVFPPSLGIEKDYLQRALSEKNIDSRPFFHPLSSIPAYQHLPQVAVARKRNVNSYRICPYGINLPSALNLTREKVSYVCETLTEIVYEHQQRPEAR
jgi:perosamine synthetase